MSYNLWVDGLRDTDRIVRLFNKQSRSREPLSGIVDGVNQFFYAQYSPILSSGSVFLYTSGSVPLDPLGFSIDSVTGMVTINTPPVVQPSLSYQTAKYSDDAMRSILIAGFDEMELHWTRGFCLSESTGSGLILVNETSTAAYITDSSGSPVVSPTGVIFENSRSQIGLYAKCVQLAFLKSMLPDSILNSYIWSEYMGLKVDKSMIGKNLLAAIKLLEDELLKLIVTAQLDWYGSTVFGGGIGTVYSQDFVAHRWWQKLAMARDYRNTQPYVGTRW